MENIKETKKFIAIRADEDVFEKLKTSGEVKSKLINNLLRNYFNKKDMQVKSDLKIFENLSEVIKINSKILLVLGEFLVEEDSEQYQELLQYSKKLNELFSKTKEI